MSATTGNYKHVEILTIFCYIVLSPSPILLLQLMSFASSPHTEACMSSGNKNAESSSKLQSQNQNHALNIKTEKPRRAYASSPERKSKVKRKKTRQGEEIKPFSCLNYHSIPFELLESHTSKPKNLCVSLCISPHEAAV